MKMTKAQERRMVRAIASKSKTLYLQIDPVLNVNDMAVIEKLCKKWMKRIG